MGEQKEDMSAGRFCWNECMSTDVDAAKKFYSGLFGWTFETMDMPNGVQYNMAKRPGEEMPVAGMMQMPPEAGNAPSHWMAYVSVDDVDASVAKAQELGGTVIMPKMEIPMGFFAVIQDPTGATFSFWQHKPCPPDA